MNVLSSLSTTLEIAEQDSINRVKAPRYKVELLKGQTEYESQGKRETVEGQIINMEEQGGR